MFKKKSVSRAVIFISLKCVDSLCLDITTTVRRWRRLNCSDKKLSLRLLALIIRAVSGADCWLRHVVSGAGLKAHPRLASGHTRGKKLTRLAPGTKGESDPVRIATVRI